MSGCDSKVSKSSLKNGATNQIVITRYTHSSHTRIFDFFLFDNQVHLVYSHDGKHNIRTESCRWRQKCLFAFVRKWQVSEKVYLSTLFLIFFEIPFDTVAKGNYIRQQTPHRPTSSFFLLYPCLYLYHNASSEEKRIDSYSGRVQFVLAHSNGPSLQLLLRNICCFHRCSLDITHPTLRPLC